MKCHSHGKHRNKILSETITETNLQVTMDKKTHKDADKKIERAKDRSAGDLRKSNKHNQVEIELKDRGDSRAITNQTMKPKDRGDSRLTANIKLMKPGIEKKNYGEDTKKTNEIQKRDIVKKTEDLKPLSNQRIKNVENKNVTAGAKTEIYRDILKKSLIRIAEENSRSKIITNRYSKVVEEKQSSDTSKKSLLRIAEESSIQKAKLNVEKKKYYEKNSTPKKEFRKTEENANQKSRSSFEKKRVEDGKNSESSRKSLIKMIEEITDYSEDFTNQIILANVDKKKVVDDNINTSKKDISRLTEEMTNRKTKMNVEKKKEESKNDQRDPMKKDEATPKTYLDLEGRKKLRQRYTVKLKNSHNLNKSEVRDTKENEINVAVAKLDERSARDKFNESREPNCTEPMTMKQSCQRKPIIKTVTVKNDNRVYKAVTFVDQKQHTPLEINIPNYKKQKAREVKITLSKVKLKSSKESIKEVIKRIKAKRRGRRPRILSPEFFTKGNASPPTEVARWAPSCINHHTKPYYEAWVDTTLAAISKCSTKDKLYIEKQNLIKTFKRALEERPETPELVYEKFSDERYTGRIKVRQR